MRQRRSFIRAGGQARASLDANDMRYDTAVLIVAAGRGERAGGIVPKQFALLGGVPVIARAVDAFGDLPVFVVIAEGQQAALARAFAPGKIEAFVIGGATRQESVRNGLAAIDVAGGAEKVLIHDAARPLLPQAVLDALIAALDTYDGAVPVLPVADSLARGDDVMGETVNRSGLWRVQTPQAFRMKALMTSLAQWTGEAATDEAQVVRSAGFTVATVPGDAMLDKITHPADFARAEAMLASRMISRSASGFDVHKLELGEELWLGGIRIAHTHGLSGHSDADVALHAITDAVLGTIGAGDIGSHFPPTDPQWRGAASHQFLAYAADLVAARGGTVDFIDLTLICEAPKIGPRREAMRTRIAEILRVPTSRISVKATTTERLGFTGRGEGIAAQAIATVRIPEDM
jgi:2-C-methyl-D-erythritol 4-phosphate cytidylyltransferase / 2-C-methyl-D-erythritol 2,4-cyclodiphosphate synthase